MNFKREHAAFWTYLSVATGRLYVIKRVAATIGDHYHAFVDSILLDTFSNWQAAKGRCQHHERHGR